MSEDQALTMQAGMDAGGVSTSKEGIENYMKLTRNIADQVRMFGDFQVKDLESLERNEQLLFAKQMESGMYGDASKYSGFIEQIRKQELLSGEQLKSVTGQIGGAIGTEANLKTSQQEIESRWYAGNIGGMHWNLLGNRQADRRAREDEERVREQLAGLGLDKLDDKSRWTGKYKEEMSQSQAEIGFWMTALKGEAASSMLTPEAQEQWLSKKYGDAEIKRMAENQINLIIDGGFNGMDWLTQDQRAAIAALVDRQLIGALSPML